MRSGGAPASGSRTGAMIAPVRNPVAETAPGHDGTTKTGKPANRPILCERSDVSLVVMGVLVWCALPPAIYRAILSQ